MSSVDTFEWPCDRRDAHGPHLIEHEVVIQDGRGNAVRAEVVEQDCPGVPAHPTTMIGGGYTR